jgi:DNA processing protein
MGDALTKMSIQEAAPLLAEIPDPPAHIYVRGTLPPSHTRHLAVVGSRNYTNYGKQVVQHLISGLRGYPVSIISGLALGIDAFAHEAALAAGLHTLAVPGSGLDDAVLYPRRNLSLAHRILESGGGLLSEFEPAFTATQWSFPKRNRIMAGLSHAVLLIEAGERSGTLITARLAVEYNRELLVVPGSIFSENSHGVHQFLKLGATPVTTSAEILAALHIDAHSDLSAIEETTLSETEQRVLAALHEPQSHDALVRILEMPTEEVLMLLMQMELRGQIREDSGVFLRV